MGAAGAYKFPPLQAQEPSRPIIKVSRISIMTLVDTLTERNREFARTEFLPELKIVPSTRTIIIGCVDPRVDPAELFALKQGEAAIIRNVGGRVYPSTVQTMDMLTEVARASGGALGKGWNVVVLHHTDCGINRLGHAQEMLADHFGVSSPTLSTLAVTDPVASIAVDIAALKADERLSGDVVVSGLVYDVTTGVATTIVPPMSLRPDSAG
jgi:carbonic anhydrase